MRKEKYRPSPPFHRSMPPICIAIRLDLVVGVAGMLLSRQAGQTKGLRGQLPTKLSQASALRHFMISHQNLEGYIPPLHATFSTLALYGNRFSLLQSARWRNDSVVVMHINLLSCPPPTCGGIGTDLSRQTLAK